MLALGGAFGWWVSLDDGAMLFAYIEQVRVMVNEVMEGYFKVGTVEEL